MTGFASKRMMTVGRQKANWIQTLKQFYDMQPSPKIFWQRLPGCKIRATWVPGPRGFEMGLRESDFEPIQKWCQETDCGHRINFNTFQFKNDKQLTMFVLRWS